MFIFVCWRCQMWRVLAAWCVIIGYLRTYHRDRGTLLMCGVNPEQYMQELFRAFLLGTKKQMESTWVTFYLLGPFKGVCRYWRSILLEKTPTLPHFDPSSHLIHFNPFLQYGVWQTAAIQCAMSTVVKTLTTFPVESTIVKVCYVCRVCH